MSELIAKSLQRNHPEITLDELEDLFDANTLQILFNTVIEVSYPRKDDGKGKSEKN